MAWCERVPKFSSGIAPNIEPRDLQNFGRSSSRTCTQGERRIGAITAIKARAPVLGGNFGVWGGLFSTFDCAVKGVRQKEDPWNASESMIWSGWTRLKCCSHCGVLHWRSIGNSWWMGRS